MRSRTILIQTFLVITLLSIYTSRSVAQGGISLDQSFAQNGRLKVNGLRYPTSLVLADGRLLVASTNPNLVVLNLFKRDGTPDAAFGSGGGISYMHTSLNPSFAPDAMFYQPYTMAQQADGKVLVMGSTQYSDGGNPITTLGTFFLRVNLDGSLDQSFGTNGCITKWYKYSTPGGLCNTEAVKVMIAPDGKIIGVGVTNWDLNTYPLRREYKTIVWRFLPDGSPDASFGQGGVCLGHFDSKDYFAENAAIKANGNIVVVGNATLNGSSPGPFVDEISTSGAALFPVPFPNTRGAKSLAHAFIMMPGDVSYLTEGYHDIMYPSPVVIQKCEGNTFKTNFTEYDFPPSVPSNPPNEFSKFYVTDMIAQGNDIIVCGFRRQSPTMPVPDAQDLCLLRLKSDGTLDTKFNNSSPYYLEPISQFFSTLPTASREFKLHLSTSDQAVFVYTTGVHMNDLQLAKYKLDFPLTVEDVKSQEFASVHPNPAHSQVSINFKTNTNENRSAELFDGVGRRVAAWDLSKTLENIKLDLPSLASGHYFLILHSGTLSKTEKLIIQ